MKALVILILTKALLLACFIQFGPIGLGPDEAQYWTWSQELAFGYYSKPPGIAWIIRAGTMLFGNTEFGVRFGALLIGSLLPLAVYHLAVRANLSSRQAIWAAVVMALSPLGIMASFFATTDGPMTLFWTLGLAAILQGEPLILGAMIALGALFKWPIYLLWLFGIPFFHLRPKLFMGIVLSLLGLLPTFYWNFWHDFATFRHIGHAVQETGSSGNPLEFFGAQAALVSPIFFILLLLSYGSLCKNYSKIEKKVRYLGAVSLLLLVVYIVIACFKKMQGNWCVFAYPAAFVYLAWWAIPRLQLWMRWGAGLSVGLTAFVLLYPLPHKYSPFRHNLGWRDLAVVLEEAGYDAKKHVLFSDKYQTTSILSFYGPEQKRAYFLNINSARLNQFSFWPQMKEGQSGFFVAIPPDEKSEKNLSGFFENILAKGVKALGPGKNIELFNCQNYNGLKPESKVSW